jgi:hypothetical protein
MLAENRLKVLENMVLRGMFTPRGGSNRRLERIA